MREYFAETRRAFPDQRNELVALHHGDEAVVAEVWVRGTQDGPLRVLRFRGPKLDTGWKILPASDWSAE